MPTTQAHGTAVSKQQIGGDYDNNAKDQAHITLAPFFTIPLPNHHYPCQADLSYRCEEYGCARKGGHRHAPMKIHKPKVLVIVAVCPSFHFRRERRFDRTTEYSKLNDRPDFYFLGQHLFDRVIKSAVSAYVLGTELSVRMMPRPRSIA